MAFPPTRYRDINTWLPYFSERITPVVPTRLRDAHFYTIGPHMHLHHLDYVVLQRHHQLVCAFQHEQLTFWPRVHRDTDKLMHMPQFYHHHLRAYDDQGGLIDFLYGTASNRAKEMIHSAKHAIRDLRRQQEIPVYLKNHSCRRSHGDTAFDTKDALTKMSFSDCSKRLSSEPLRHI